MTNGFDAYHQWLGIAPRDQPPHHYRLLGVDLFESDPDVIESAADRQMTQVRSFQSGPHGDVSQKLLNEITAAKLCLLSAARKAEYDAQLRAEQEAAEDAARLPARAVPDDHSVAEAEPLESADTDLGPPMPRPPEGALQSSLGDTAAAESTTLGTAKLGRRRMPLWQQAAIAGGLLGGLVMAVIALLALMANDPGTVRGVDSLPPTSSKQPTPQDIKTPGNETNVAVYLDDLQEAEVRVGQGAFGKHGDRAPGTDLPYCTLEGQTATHALHMHPGESDVAYAVYKLNGEYRTLRAAAALADLPPQLAVRAASAVEFRVRGDGKLLWQSTPLQQCGRGERCVVNIEGVKVLKLEAYCPGSNAYAGATWFNPKVTKAGSSDSSSAAPARPDTVGYYHLTTTPESGGAKTNTTIGLADDGHVQEGPLEVGRWSASGSDLRLVFDDQRRGTVQLASADKDRLTGRQTLAGGDVVAWELTRLDSRLLGRWAVTYTNAALRHYEVRKDATVAFVDERITARLIKAGGYYLLDFGDGKLDRFKFDTTLEVEHYNPRAALAAGGRPDQLGSGVREDSP